MPEVGIVMTLNDKVSSALKTIAGHAKAFDKELDELEAGFQDLAEAQTKLVNKQTELKKSLEASSVKVADARKEYRKLKDETSKGALDAAIDEQGRLQQALKATEEEIKLNNKAYAALERSAIDAANGIREAEIRSGDAAQGFKEDARSIKDSMDGGSGILDRLGKSGLMGLVGGAISNAPGAYLESLLGQPSATLVGSTLSGAAQGAAMGMAMGSAFGVPGVVVGALAGGTAGLINGMTAASTAKDDAFKSYVQDAVEGQLAEMDSIRASGSAIAGQREQDQLAFAQRFGSEEAAREYLDRVKAMAVNTNYSYDEITGYSKSLLNTYDAGETFDVLQKLSDATAGLNLNSGDVSMFINGLARMRTTDKATQEYLNYFSERGLDVYEALSRSTGADKSAIAGMVSKGDISGTDAAQAILDYIQEEFGGLSEALASTYDAMADNLGDAEANLNAMMGEGYNEARKAGIQEQTGWLESGELAEAYKAIGAWKAELENAKERYVREAVDEAMDSKDYKAAEASGDAAEMGRIIMQAQIKGMGEYNANEGRDEALAQELDLIEGVRNDAALNDGYWDAGYTLGQAFSKGRAAGMKESNPIMAIFTSGPDYDPDYDPARAFLGDENAGARRDQAAHGKTIASSAASAAADSLMDGRISTLFSGTSRHAFGLERVPYDGYPALLHEGERVLTARETRLMDRGAFQAGEAGREREGFPVSFSLREPAANPDRSAAGPPAVNLSVTVSGNTFGAGLDEAAVAQALADQIELQLRAGGGR